MVTATIRANDYYMDILSVLSNVEKLDLISRLTASMSVASRRRKKADQLTLLKSFKGDWGGDMPVCEYAESLRNSVPTERGFDTW